MKGDSFEAFYLAVHGHAPFPWQVRAAHQLARRETFVVSVPTGLGKSAMVDAAVWAASQGAWRRIAFVVDRRIVVDAVHQRALRIAQRLDVCQTVDLRAMAEKLGQIQVVRLRGGVFGDDDWVLYPERLTIALTTVDQLGSRLMFRGYGVSPRRWSLHAGFFGSDTLIVVDEAHLSNPFLETLHRLRDAGADVAVVPMSATLAAQDKLTLALQEDDLALPTVQKRLTASKRIRLIECDDGEAGFAQQCVDEVQTLCAAGDVRRIALIVNRVATARRCFAKLKALGVDVDLLTGRIRPADRDVQLGQLLGKVEAGRPRAPGERLHVLVATQTIEVGADFDFDAIVTESAPLSSLRQRFGRQDRLGTLGQTQGAIVHRAKTNDDPVYGLALEAAWAWLRSVAEPETNSIDMGLKSFEQLVAQTAAPVEAQVHAASLLPTHLQLLSQTGHFAPEVSLASWLHGATDRAPDVSLIWRDDLAPDKPEHWLWAVRLLPPMAREALSMPVSAIRRWLTGGKLGEQWSDLDATADDDVQGSTARPVLRWRGLEDSEVIDAKDIRPGDVLVLPSVYGGCDAWGWAPDSTEAVADLADTCIAEQIEAGAHRRVVMRLSPVHWQALGGMPDRLDSAAQALRAVEAEVPTSEADLTDQLAAARDELVHAALDSRHPLARLCNDPLVERHPDGYVIVGRGIEELQGVIETGRAVTLDVHHADVARWAWQLAAHDPCAVQIQDAAKVHDAGKSYGPMQALFHGSTLAAAAGPVLAKSALRRRRDQGAAWQTSPVPRGFRHEFASLDSLRGADPLTRHLTATHHGLGRPWLAPCADPAAPGADHAALDSHWLEAWADAVATHGPWALARMEWLLRAADARASIEEAQLAQEDTR